MDVAWVELAVHYWSRCHLQHPDSVPSSLQLSLPWSTLPILPACGLFFPQTPKLSEYIYQFSGYFLELWTQNVRNSTNGSHFFGIYFSDARIFSYSVGNLWYSEFDKSSCIFVICFEKFSEDNIAKFGTYNVRNSTYCSQFFLEYIFQMLEYCNSASMRSIFSSNSKIFGIYLTIVWLLLRILNLKCSEFNT